MPISIYSRYYGLDTVEENGRISLAQRPAIPSEAFPDSIIHTVVGNETIDQLAARYYGREDLWWRIADANPNKFPLDWKPGDTLVIPPIQVATRTPRR
jgi:nucleoid-associated protein YgaU